MTGSGDRDWMLEAIGLSRRCPPSPGAYSVGAVIVGRDGAVLSTGYSRENDPHIHAEESALDKLPHPDPRLAEATLYSTLEPCSRRRHGSVPCARRIIASGLRRVVIAWREPSLLVADCVGVEILTGAGVIVIELPELADVARAVNSHLLQ
jgi:diaminohydroxyphosphoribosylaminopyrimidine deaminase/5-amino-6-(5-phosphoribosylamino)uracil reductase